MSVYAEGDPLPPKNKNLDTKDGELFKKGKKEAWLTSAPEVGGGEEPNPKKGKHKKKQKKWPVMPESKKKGPLM